MDGSGPALNHPVAAAYMSYRSRSCVPLNSFHSNPLLPLSPPKVLSRDGWSLLVDEAPTTARTDPFVGGATMRFAAAAEDGVEKNAGEEAEEDMIEGASEGAHHTGGDAWVDGSPWQAYPDGGGAGASYDAYFFGCGASHRACLGDFAALSGAVPIPPKQTMGVWWSKYDEELKGILEYIL